MTLFLLVFPVLIELFGPSPRIIVSEETTVITEPLATDGLPDYQQFWLTYGREGVTFENNAAVPFWQAIWPGELSQKYWLPMSQALGFERVPSPTNSLRDPYSNVVRERGFMLIETGLETNSRCILWFGGVASTTYCGWTKQKLIFYIRY